MIVHLLRDIQLKYTKKKQPFLIYVRKGCRMLLLFSLPHIACAFNITIFWSLWYRLIIHFTVNERAVLRIVQVIWPLGIFHIEVRYLDICDSFFLVTFIENTKLCRFFNVDIVDAEVRVSGREVTATIMQIVCLEA